MAFSVFKTLKDRASAPVTDRWLEALVGLALASWTLGNLVMSRTEIASHAFFTAHSYLQFAQAFTFGCLVAVIASKAFDLSAPGLVLFGLTLFTALAFRARSGDYHLVALLLFIVASQGMDFARLARYWLCAALAAVVLTLLFMDKTNVLNRYVMVRGRMVGLYGFNSPQVISSLLTGVDATAVLTFRDRRLRVPLLVFCAVCAATCFFVQRAGFEAWLIVLMGLVVFAEWRGFGWEFLRERSLLVRCVVALLPVALAIATYDLMVFYNLASVGATGGGYLVAVQTYGLGFVVCFALLYMRAILVAPFSRETVLRWAVLLLMAWYLAASNLPALMEFNPTFLVLSVGLGSASVRDAVWGKAGDAQ